MHMVLTLVKLENILVSSRTYLQLSKPQVLGNGRDRRESLTFPKVMLSATRLARSISSAGDKGE